MFRPQLKPLTEAPANAVEALLDSVFGADRHGRTAYALRAGTAPLDSLCFGAWDADGVFVGSIQAWPVVLATDEGAAHPLVMVGPVAITPALQGIGIGRALMAALGEAAERSDDPGATALMLIGDPEYYGRFGFTDAATGGWRVPGPVERHRLLARGPRLPAVAGLLGPRVATAAARRLPSQPALP